MIGKKVRCSYKKNMIEVYDFDGIVRDKVKTENKNKNLVDIYLISDEKNDIFQVLPENVLKILE